MASQITVGSVPAAIAATTLQDVDAFKQLNAFLRKVSEIEVLRHFTTDPLLGAPAILDDAVGIFPDLEWFDNKRMPNVPVKITEVGFTVFPMAALRDCNNPADFPALIKKAAVYHIRLLDHCHMRNKGFGSEDAEKNSLYCLTCFIPEADAQKIFVDVLNNQKLPDGRRAPVILVGQGWEHDENYLKKEWKLNVNKLDSVVYKIYSLGTLAHQAGIVPKPDHAAGERNPKFDDLLAGFGVDIEGLWRHNGANDAVYQMTVAFLVTLFPCLYSDTTTGFPVDATLAGRSIKDLWLEFAAHNKHLLAPTWGLAQFCHYCETANDHDAVNCPTVAAGTIICQLCKNSVGPKNKTYREKAVGHQTSRCILQYNHHVRGFPKWFMDLKPSLDHMRILSQASAIKDFSRIGEVMYHYFFAPGWIGRDEVADEEKRLRAEEMCYSDDDEVSEGETVQDLSSPKHSAAPLGITAANLEIAVASPESMRDLELEEARKEAAEWKRKYEELYEMTKKK